MQLSLTKKIVSTVVLLTIVAASATQTEAAKYLSSNRGYAKPYFTFYLTHSAFLLIVPLHFLLLRIFRPNVKSHDYVDGLRVVLVNQLQLSADSDWDVIRWKLGRIILLLTALVSLPSLSWYIAVPLTGVSEITTIYASSSFWTYGFALWLLHEPLSRTIVAAITLAFAGVLVITYSGVEQGRKPSESRIEARSYATESSHRILGDVIMLAGSVFLGYYEVVYKQILPEDPGLHGLPQKGISHGENPPLGRGRYRRISSHSGVNPFTIQDEPENHLLATTTTGDTDVSSPGRGLSEDRPTRTRSGRLPIAFHANFLTSLIGLATFGIFWIPIPILNMTRIEDFELPSGSWSVMGIICLAGATYNAGFMVLIGILGPVTASLANLLTIAVVAAIENIFGQAMNVWAMIGASLVGMGFALILWQGEVVPDETLAESDLEDGVP